MLSRLAAKQGHFGETLIKNVIKRNENQPFQTINSFIKKRFISNCKMDEQTDVFTGQIDRYNGITIDTQQTAINLDRFPQQLEKSLETWRAAAYRTVWFKINLNDSGIVPILTKSGFDFHHARTGFVTMYKWLPTDTTPNIPAYAHTMIGVGGLVVNDRDQILTISEKHAIIPGSWKLPGGYVEPDEHFVDAAIREVVEETGIRTKFDSLVCMRHAHGSAKLNFGFGCSDVYIVIALKPETEEITLCDREILQCEWLDFDKYLEHPKVHSMNRVFLRTFIENRRKGIHITCKDHIHDLLQRQYQIYSADKIE